jgi:HAD superfamily hydrolase (TIGR01509 family)
VLQSHGVSLSEDEIIERMSSRVIDQIDVAVPWRPGALELLTELGELGVPTALVTMSIRRMAERVARAVGGVGFAAIVAGDEVTHSKPHPEPYLMGAAALGVAASDCVALEDSAPGVASASAAGAVVIGVPMHVALEEHSSYHLWPDLHGKNAEDLFAIYRERRNP